MALLGQWNKFWLLVVVVMFSCGQENQDAAKPKRATNATKQDNKLVPMPDFYQDSAYFFVEKQVAFGPRVPNSKAHQQCLNWITDFLSANAWTIQNQSGVYKAHDGKDLNFTNIIAKYNPDAKERIQLSAHWDTRPWADQDSENQEHPIDGANDGASGVAVILEIARLIAQDSLSIGVDIVLFDIEDYGISSVENSFCYGSQYWYRNFDAQQIIPRFGINLDMVGDAKAQFLYEGFSMQYARPVLDKVWNTAKDLGYQNYFISKSYGYITDDHLWVNKVGIPCINIIHKDPVTQSFPATWHTHEDNMDNISPKMLKIVGDVVLQSIYKENQKVQKQ